MVAPLNTQRISGFYCYTPEEQKRLRKIYRGVESVMEDVLNYNYTSFPTVGLIEDFEKEMDHFKMNAQVFKIQDTPYFLKPTSESVAYPIVFSNTALQLPHKWYSVGPVFRNESKAVQRMVRNRQIRYFFESHAFFKTKLQAEKQIKDVLNEMKLYFEALGIFGQIRLRPIEDTFPGAEKTFAIDVPLENGKAAQVCTMHYLGTRFSEIYSNNKISAHGVCMGFTERVLGIQRSLYNEALKWIDNPYSIISFGLKDKKENTLKPELKGVYSWAIRENQRTTEEVKKYIQLYTPCFYFLYGPKEKKGALDIRYIHVETNEVFENLETVTKCITQKRHTLLENMKKLCIQRGKKLSNEVYGDPISVENIQL